MSTPEGEVRDAICEYLEQVGVFIFIHDSVGIYDPIKQRFRTNRNRFRRRGVNDILGIYKGHFLGIEVKTPELKNYEGKTVRAKTYPNEYQKFFIEDVLRNGGISFVARSTQDVKRGLTEWESAHGDRCPCNSLRSKTKNQDSSGA